MHILDEDHKILTTDDVEVWSKLLGDRKAHLVAQDRVKEYLLSTVFVGVQYGIGPNGEPLVFETICFDKDMNEIECIRYETWEQAEWGHKETLCRMIARFDTEWFSHYDRPIPQCLMEECDAQDLAT